MDWGFRVQRKDRKGKDVWVPVEVDIDAHIIEPAIDTSAPRCLENYITDLSVAPPLDVTRPMWQCHILNGPSGEGDGQPAANMVVRVHHALGDGTSLMSLLLACTRRLGHPEELPAVPVARRKDPEPKSVFRKALDVLALIWNTLVGVFLFTATAIWLKDSDSLIKGHAGVEKEKKKLVFVTLSMTDMATVKNAVNGVSFSSIPLYFTPFVPCNSFSVHWILWLITGFIKAYMKEFFWANGFHLYNRQKYEKFMFLLDVNTDD